MRPTVGRSPRGPTPAAIRLLLKSAPIQPPTPHAHDTVIFSGKGTTVLGVGRRWRVTSPPPQTPTPPPGARFLSPPYLHPFAPTDKTPIPRSQSLYTHLRPGFVSHEDAIQRPVCVAPAHLPVPGLYNSHLRPSFQAATPPSPLQAPCALYSPNPPSRGIPPFQTQYTPTPPVPLLCLSAPAVHGLTDLTCSSFQANRGLACWHKCQCSL